MNDLIPKSRTDNINLKYHVQNNQIVITGDVPYTARE